MKRLIRLIPFLIIYVLVHQASGDTVRSYDGQSQSTIQSLLVSEGKTGDVITQQQYVDFIVAHQPVPLTPAQVLAIVRSQASTSVDSGVEPISELQRAVLLTVLDELNILRGRDRDRSADVAAATSLADLKTRWAARLDLLDRTPAQAKNAVQSKINSGASD